MKRVDLTGMRFGKLVCTGFASSDGRRARWRCRCECGTECDVMSANLTSGHSTTCGASCHRTIPTSKQRHPLYQVWREMHRRCTNPSSTSYRYYGAKGVTVAPEWKDFWRFVVDIGERPSTRHQLDRIRATDPYSKDTCRWVTAGENSRNREFVKLTDELAAQVKLRLAVGESKRAIADSLGVSADCIHDIHRGRTWKHVAATPAPDGVIPQGA